MNDYYKHSQWQPLLAAIFIVLSAFTQATAQTDVTSKIVNSNFDGRSFAGWQQQGLWFQTNSSFEGKSNYAYVEQWVQSPGKLTDPYIRQTLTGLAKGRYTLTVAAHHTQNGEPARGCYLFADWQERGVSTYADYSLTFDVLTDDVTIGIRCQNSAANWFACDNWRLTLESTDVSYLRTGLSNLISSAQTIEADVTDASVKSMLADAISDAQRYTSDGSATNISAVATTLKEAMLLAERSMFAAKTSATSGVPRVTTDKRYARGATAIFGRSIVDSPTDILEQGFCYSTTNEKPTVADPRTTRYVENGGRIYCLDNLQPGTLYYIRAYAVTTSYQVGYGEALRVYTLPKGNVTWSHEGGSDDEYQRIAQSIMSVAHYWSNLTSITGFAPSSHYGSGTPTADCSYGGWIRVGPNESYQATGTLLHEAGHGIGVGTHSTYYGDIRTNNNTGYWLGKRATRFLQFWDNSDGVRLYGDATHLWASGAANGLSYTINGANEDSHGDASYYGNSLLMQAIVEDGLAPVGGNLQGLAYTLDSDGRVFVIRNSDDDFGLRTSYLVDDNGSLQLRKLTTAEAQSASNHALWTMTFDPASQTYRIQNTQSKRYICYVSDNTANGFKTTTSSSGEVSLRLQLSFADVSVGLATAPRILDCYHIMRAASTPTPQALCVMSATTTGSQPFSNTHAATVQRWVFVDVDELEELQNVMDLEEPADPGYNITSAMAPFLCTGSLHAWTNDGMKVNYTDGSAPYISTSDGARIDFPFIERWVDSAVGTLPDTEIQQTLTELPDGYYYLRGSFIACTQTDADIVITGVTFHAGDQSVDIATGNGTPKRYVLRVKVTDGTLTFGLSIKNTPANWVAMDNLQLFYDGTEDEYLAHATPCRPVRVPVFNSTFDQWNLNGWTQSGTWQTMNADYNHISAPFAESWTSWGSVLADRSLTQTVTLPAGAYSLQAAVEAVQQNDASLAVSGVTLRIGDEATACHTANEAPELFSVDALLDAGSHTLGLYVENTDANWVAADNFVLRYYGPHPLLPGDVSGDGSIDASDVTALVSYLLGIPTPHFLSCAADVNNDGRIDIADVTALVNRLGRASK